MTESLQPVRAPQTADGFFVEANSAATDAMTCFADRYPTTILRNNAHRRPAQGRGLIPLHARFPSDPPAAVFFYSPDRGGQHPEQHLAGYAGLMQADAYAGFNKLYEANRKGGPIIEAACWAHGRRKFFDLARLSGAPAAAEASSASTFCSPSSVRSTVLCHKSACACARSVVAH